MAIHVIVSGRVQGVGFRYAAKQSAVQHKLVGWVRNKEDGTVEMEIAGDHTNIEQYLEDMKSGFSPFIRVDQIQVESTSATEQDFTGFSIKQ
ncbi:acylphosphatase [Lentibacillus sp. L22]|uniref:acylphosphatase n=1 Tax=Lentibacillus TaxID=175304 RepID=UPI0022B0951E|nr:acylphosphatase [Lentibacillus daqui]